MKIVYCGYDFFAGCLEELLSMKNIEILKVFTYKTDNIYNFNEKILNLAGEHKIPVSLDKVSEEDINKLSDEGCECFITAAYPYKVPIQNKPGINIHPTLLPIGRGRWPLPRVILSGQERSGVTIHKLTDKFDSGDILIQEGFNINQTEDLETLSCRSQMLARRLVQKLFNNFRTYWDNAVPQGKGEYWAYPTDDEMSFNGDMTVREIDRIIRAYGKFDSCTCFNGKSWLVWDANCWEEEHNYTPGDIVHETNKEYLMAVKDGFVCFRFFKEEKQNEE